MAKSIFKAQAFATPRMFGKAWRQKTMLRTTATGSIARPIWLLHIIIFVAVFLFSLGMAFVFCRGATLADLWESRLRTTGGVLQLFGVLSVALGIWKLRRSFGLGTVSGEIVSELWALIVKCGRRIARIFGRHRHYEIALEGGTFKTTGSLTHFKIGRQPNLSVEQRLALLENRFDQIQDLIANLQDGLQKEIDLRTAAISKASNSFQRSF